MIAIELVKFTQALGNTATMSTRDPRATTAPGPGEKTTTRPTIAPGVPLLGAHRNEPGCNPASRNTPGAVWTVVPAGNSGTRTTASC
jgi:hypothetical protein